MAWVRKDYVREIEDFVLMAGPSTPALRALVVVGERERARALAPTVRDQELELLKQVLDRPTTAGVVADRFLRAMFACCVADDLATLAQLSRGLMRHWRSISAHTNSAEASQVTLVAECLLFADLLTGGPRLPSEAATLLAGTTWREVVAAWGLQDGGAITLVADALDEKIRNAESASGCEPLSETWIYLVSIRLHGSANLPHGNSGVPTWR